MDFSKILGILKGKGASKAASIAGAAGADIEAQAAKMAGMNPQMLEELIGQLKGMLADGKITPEEVRAQLEKVATQHGIPSSMAKMAVQAVMDKLGVRA